MRKTVKETMPSAVKRQKKVESPVETASTANVLDELQPKGFLAFPNELISKVLSYFRFPSRWTRLELGSHDPVLPHHFLQRERALRVLSQTSRAYRIVFLPLLWESLDVCSRGSNMVAFYKHLGDTLARKSKGLARRKDLCQYIR
jgi:hypothetical protein